MTRVMREIKRHMVAVLVNACYRSSTSRVCPLRSLVQHYFLLLEIYASIRGVAALPAVVVVVVVLHKHTSIISCCRCCCLNRHPRKLRWRRWRWRRRQHANLANKLAENAESQIAGKSKPNRNCNCCCPNGGKRMEWRGGEECGPVAYGWQSGVPGRW